MSRPTARRGWAVAGVVTTVALVAIVAMYLFFGSALIPRPRTGSDPALPPLTDAPPAADASAPPSDSLYVDGKAGTSGDGTSAHPFMTLGEAVAHARAGGTIVLASGVYHEFVHVDAAPDLTIRSAPGATVWLDGSVPATNPSHDGQTWRFRGQAPELDRSPTYTRGAPDNRREGWRFVPPERPLAADPSQVWYDGHALRQVGAGEDIGPGAFAVDGDDMLLGDDPRGHDVRIGTLRQGLFVSSPRVRVLGIGFRRYVPSVPDFGAVVLAGQGGVLKNVSVVDSSTGGVSVQGEGVLLDHITVQRSGMLGVAAHRAFGLRILGGRFTQNNSLGFNMAPNAGGIKITETAPLEIRGAQIDHNLGVGLWLDESVGDALVAGVRAEKNSLHGVVVELSSRVNVVGCHLTSNDGNGLRVQNSDQVDVMNVTSTGNRRALDYVQDGRVVGAANAPAVSSDPRIPPMTWRIGRSTVVNSVLGDSTGDTEFAVEDFTRTLDADSIGIRLNANLYRLGRVSPDHWTHVWSKPHRDPDVYTTLGAFVAATGQDTRSTEQRGTRRADAPAPVPIPEKLRRRAHLPAAPAIGAP